jgi:hypothetical protein
MLEKVQGYYIYRSEELSGNRPIIDGLYIQRDELMNDPPDEMDISLRW